MPTPYERQGGWDGLWQPSSTDKVLGMQEAKRSTKTFISSEKSSIILALIKNHAEGLLEFVTRQHQRENKLDKPATQIEILRAYPGVRKWLNLHMELVEHGVSVQGFSLKVAARMESNEAQQGRPESSIQGGRSNG